MIRNIYILLLLSLSYSATLLVPSEYSTIQSAIDASSSGDTVLVSAGTYLENINFNGKNIAVIGEDRENTIIDGGQNGSVVTFDSIEGTASALSNFTITGGNAYDGGGIYLSDSDPSLKNLTIISNTASDKGGGMYLNQSDPTITNVIISENMGDDGGGLFLSFSNPIFSNVKIRDNIATYGGGMRAFDSNPKVFHTNISGNTAEFGGGAVMHRSNPIFSNIVFSDNTAEADGAGIYLHTSNATLTNVTFSGNSAEDQGGGIYMSTSNSILKNVIIWDNNPESILGGGVFVTYSDIEGGWEGEGNIDADPLFTDPNNGDFTLQDGSPCIDTGILSPWYADLDFSRCDMGFNGGSSILINFEEYDFGIYGTEDMVNTVWTLFNFRETAINLSGVSFSTNTFNTSTTFPIIIEPLVKGEVFVDCLPETVGIINDSMMVESMDILDGAAINLTVEGVDGTLNPPDYYVSIYGDDNWNGTEEFPFLTIGKVFSIISNFTEFDPFTINLSEGVFAPNTTGETFPITMLSNINLIGQGKDVTILDANYSQKVMIMVNCENNTISDLAISGGNQNYGGGISINNSTPLMKNISINNNYSPGLCGGISIENNSDLTLINSILYENDGFAGGGAMRINQSSPHIMNVLIFNNVSKDGAGIHIVNNSHPTITNVTLYGNLAEMDGGGILISNSNPILMNTIIWDNSPESIYLWGNEQPIITYSDIEGGWEGEGNIDADPLFSDPESGDYTLMEGSPCIDAGIIIEDMEYCGSAPDMGAYEYITEDCEECGADLADVNGDSEINILDLKQIADLILEVSTPAYACAADYNQDGQVNILDLVQISNYILNP